MSRQGRPAGAALWEQQGALLDTSSIVQEVKVIGVKGEKVYVWKQPPGKDPFVATIKAQHLSKKQHAPHLIDPPPGAEEFPPVGDIGDPAAFSGAVADIKPVEGAEEVPQMTQWMKKGYLAWKVKQAKAAGVVPQDTFSKALAAGEPLPTTFPEPVGIVGLPKKPEPPEPEPPEAQAEALANKDYKALVAMASELVPAILQGIEADYNDKLLASKMPQAIYIAAILADIYNARGQGDQAAKWQKVVDESDVPPMMDPDDFFSAQAAGDYLAIKAQAAALTATMLASLEADYETFTGLNQWGKAAFLATILQGIYNIRGEPDKGEEWGLKAKAASAAGHVPISVQAIKKALSSDDYTLLSNTLVGWTGAMAGNVFKVAARAERALNFDKAVRLFDLLLKYRVLMGDSEKIETAQQRLSLVKEKKAAFDELPAEVQEKALAFRNALSAGDWAKAVEQGSELMALLSGIETPFKSAWSDSLAQATAWKVEAELQSAYEAKDFATVAANMSKAGKDFLTQLHKDQNELTGKEDYEGAIQVLQLLKDYYATQPGQQWVGAFGFKIMMHKKAIEKAAEKAAIEQQEAAFTGALAAGKPEDIDAGKVTSDQFNKLMDLLVASDSKGEWEQCSKLAHLIAGYYAQVVDDGKKSAAWFKEADVYAAKADMSAPAFQELQAEQSAFAAALQGGDLAKALDLALKISDGFGAIGDEACGMWKEVAEDIKATAQVKAAALEEPGGEAYTKEEINDLVQDFTEALTPAQKAEIASEIAKGWASQGQSFSALNWQAVAAVEQEKAEEAAKAAVPSDADVLGLIAEFDELQLTADKAAAAQKAQAIADACEAQGAKATAAVWQAESDKLQFDANNAAAVAAMPAPKVLSVDEASAALAGGKLDVLQEAATSGGLLDESCIAVTQAYYEAKASTGWADMVKLAAVAEAYHKAKGNDAHEEYWQQAKNNAEQALAAGDLFNVAMEATQKGDTEGLYAKASAGNLNAFELGGLTTALTQLKKDKQHVKAAQALAVVAKYHDQIGSPDAADWKSQQQEEVNAALKTVLTYSEANPEDLLPLAPYLSASNWADIKDALVVAEDEESWLKYAGLLKVIIASYKAQGNAAATTMYEDDLADVQTKLGMLTTGAELTDPPEPEPLDPVAPAPAPAPQSDIDKLLADINLGPLYTKVSEQCKAGSLEGGQAAQIDAALLASSAEAMNERALLSYLLYLHWRAVEPGGSKEKGADTNVQWYLNEAYNCYPAAVHGSELATLMMNFHTSMVNTKIGDALAAAGAIYFAYEMNGEDKTASDWCMRQAEILGIVGTSGEPVSDEDVEAAIASESYAGLLLGASKLTADQADKVKAAYDVLKGLAKWGPASVAAQVYAAYAIHAEEDKTLAHAWSGKANEVMKAKVTGALAPAPSPPAAAPEPAPAPATPTVEEMEAKGLFVMPWTPKPPKSKPVPSKSNTEADQAAQGLAVNEFVHPLTSEVFQVIGLGPTQYVDSNDGAIYDTADPTKPAKVKLHIVSTGNYKDVTDEAGEEVPVSAPPPGPTATYPLPEVLPEPGPSTALPPVSLSAEEVVLAMPKLPQLPKKKDLDEGKSAKSILGGAGEKYIYTDKKTGKRWMFKPAITKGWNKEIKPFAAAAQQIFYEVAKTVNPDAIPVGVIKLRGHVGTLQPLVELDSTNPTLEQQYKHPATELSAADRSYLVQEQVVDWLMSQNDNHGGQFIRLADGTVQGVDKEQCYLFLGKDELTGKYDPNNVGSVYNKLWVGWRNNDFDLDLSRIEKTVMKLQAIPTAKFIKMLRPYAESYWPGKPAEQRKFLQRARRRKLDLRRDFETFITLMYRERTGKKDTGQFTFAGGWQVPDEPVEGPSVIEKTFSSSEYLTKQGSDLGVTVKTKQHNTEPSKLLLCITNDAPDPKQRLKDICTELGISYDTAHGLVTGSYYTHVLIDKAAFEGASVKMDVPVEPFNVTSPVGPTPPVPLYFPDDIAHPPARANAADLAEVHKMNLGRSGVRFESDGAAVEGNNLTVRKWKDTQGLYYEFALKLRPNVWGELLTGHGGTDGSFRLSAAPTPPNNFDDSLDAFVATGQHHSQPITTVYWSDQGSELHIAKADRIKEKNHKVKASDFGREGTDIINAGVWGAPKVSLTAWQYVARQHNTTEQALRLRNNRPTGDLEVGDKLKVPGYWMKQGCYAWQGGVWARVRPKAGETPHEALKRLLEAVKPGLSGELLRNATPEEKEYRKLMQVLWSVAPQTADALSDSYYGATMPKELKTPAKIKEFIAASGVDVNLNEVVEEEVFPGYTCFVDKGRYKRLYEQGYRFAVQGINYEFVHSILTAGIISANQRATQGIGRVGATSENDDTKTGGADQALNYIVTKKKLSSNAGSGAGMPWASRGGAQALIHPREIGRLDYYFLIGDDFGITAPQRSGPKDGMYWRERLNIEGAINDLETSAQNKTTESAVRYGIPVRSILRITCSGTVTDISDPYHGKTYRQVIIEKCRAAGINVCNGVPIEDFVVEERNLGEMYRKYVEPLLME